MAFLSAFAELEEKAAEGGSGAEWKLREWQKAGCASPPAVAGGVVTPEGLRVSVRSAESGRSEGSRAESAVSAQRRGREADLFKKRSEEQRNAKAARDDCELGVRTPDTAAGTEEKRRPVADAEDASAHNSGDANGEQEEVRENWAGAGEKKQLESSTRPMELYYRHMNASGKRAFGCMCEERAQVAQDTTEEQTGEHETQSLLLQTELWRVLPQHLAVRYPPEILRQRAKAGRDLDRKKGAFVMRTVCPFKLLEFLEMFPL
ncbi:UNVERIFIED_CONTAM: hypothetical protein HHA_462590 [Hammondia hammondi]|eukprot:XP_008887603.1 hypothetical protein HHA_462590 [Hammondia hammondi]